MYGHQYTELEKDFFRKFIPGHSYMEIQQEFISIFGWEISISQIKGYMANHKINSGTTGHFKKGHIPVNKGNKGWCPDGCEKSWFKPGHTPKNHRPIGSERITKDGYIEIKVEEPNKWKLKHRFIWEKEFGNLSKGKCLIFLNGIKTDIRIENLMVIDRKVLARINQNGIRCDNMDSTETAVGVAKLICAIGEAKKRNTKLKCIARQKNMGRKCKAHRHINPR